MCDSYTAIEPVTMRANVDVRFLKAVFFYDGRSTSSELTLTRGSRNLEGVGG